jgi:flagellar biosynthesis protein FlhG
MNMENRAPFVLISGGKGGVGKTMLAVNLAVQMASEARRVLLVDLDLGLADAHVLLSLQPAHTISAALSGERALRECVVRAPGGFDFLAAESGAYELVGDDPTRRERLLQSLAELSLEYDIVLGDTAAGIGGDVLAFAAAADRVLLVTTPDPTALADAYGMIKALAAYSAQRGIDLPTPELVFNQVNGADQADGLATRLRAVCERFLVRSPRLAGWLPRSNRVLNSIAVQRPFALDRPLSLENHCLRRLSTRVQRWFPAVPDLAAALKG